MKSNIKLLKIVRKEFIEESKEAMEILDGTFGLCYTIISSNSFNLNEVERLNRLVIFTNIPKEMRSHNTYTGVQSNYWWINNVEGMEQRLLFLDYLISKELGWWGRMFQMLKKLF